jgi:hypothetical protein
MIFRSTVVVLGLMALAAAPLHAQGLKERATQSDRTDRAMKETNPARESGVKGTPCSCSRGSAAAPIACGACVDGLTCQATTRTLVRKACP